MILVLFISNYLGPVGGHQHLDVAPGAEAIQLVEQLQHGSLHLVNSLTQMDSCEYRLVKDGSWIFHVSEVLLMPGDHTDLLC